MVYTVNFNKNGKWLMMELTQKEEDEAIRDHRKLCNNIMKECIEDSNEDSGKVATALFQSRCPSIYGFMQNKLWDKIKMVSPENFFDMEIYFMVKEKMRGN